MPSAHSRLSSTPLHQVCTPLPQVCRWPASCQPLLHTAGFDLPRRAAARSALVEGRGQPALRRKGARPGGRQVHAREGQPGRCRQQRPWPRPPPPASLRALPWALLGRAACARGGSRGACNRAPGGVLAAALRRGVSAAALPSSPSPALNVLPCVQVVATVAAVRGQWCRLCWPAASSRLQACSPSEAPLEPAGRRSSSQSCCGSAPALLAPATAPRRVQRQAARVSCAPPASAQRMPPPGAARRAPAGGGPTHRLAALQAAQLLQGFVGGAAGQASLEAEELRRTCQLNAALCLLALGRPADAVAECDAVLRRHPAERKALYRRGLGRLALADAAAAAPDLRAALELCAAARGPPPPVPLPSRLGALSGSSPHSAVHVLGCLLAASSGVKASFGAGREAAVTAWPASDVMRCRQGARGARPSSRPPASALPSPACASRTGSQ